MSKLLIKNATIINEGRTFQGSVLVENEMIVSVVEGNYSNQVPENTQIIDATGKLLIPGVIDDQVHFTQSPCCNATT